MASEQYPKYSTSAPENYKVYRYVTCMLYDKSESKVYSETSVWKYRFTEILDRLNLKMSMFSIKAYQIQKIYRTLQFQWKSCRS